MDNKNNSILLALCRNPVFLKISAVSLVLSYFVSGDKWVEEGFKLIPQVLGVAWGGLVASVAIIFALIKDEDIQRLHQQGSKFTDALINLKNHLIALLYAFTLSILAFFIEFPFVTYLADMLNVPLINLFYFVETLLLLFSVYSVREVINSLFLVFEIRINLLSIQKDESDKK